MPSQVKKAMKEKSTYIVIETRTKHSQRRLREIVKDTLGSAPGVEVKRIILDTTSSGKLRS